MNNIDPTDIMIEILMKTATAVEQNQKMISELERLTSTATRAKAAVSGVGQAATVPPTAPKSVDNLNKSLDKTGTTAVKAGKGLWSMTNILRTALGTIEAMGLFLIFTTISKTINLVLTSVKNLEIAFYNLGNAERAMSQAGTEVSLLELEGVIDRISKKFKGMFSNVELRDATADIAIAVKDLGFGAKEIEKMLTAIAVVKLRTPAETMKDVTGHTITALLSGRTQALQAMGISANEATVKEKALEMGLISSGQALTTNIKALAILEIMFDATKGEAEDLTKYTNTLSGASQRASAAWTDFLTSLGQVAAPNIIQALNVISNWLITTNTTLVKNKNEWGRWAGSVGAAFAFISGMIEGRLAGVGFVENFKASIQAAKDAMDEAKQLATDFGKGEETSTLPIDGSTIEDDAKEIEDAIEKAKDTIDEALADLKFDQAEATIDLNLKLEDIDLDLGRKLIDAKTDYNRKISDIESDSQQKRADAISKAHDDEINKERDFQNKLLELKEKFLMDLDDALHARDARQVLRLIRQYNLEKAQMLREREDKKAENSQELARNLQEINQDRKRRLDDARKEYKQKQADLRLAAERERADARKDYDRKLADLQRAYSEKRNAMIREIILEKNLTAQGAKAVYDALSAYRPGGVIWNTWYEYLKYVKTVQAGVSGVQNLPSSAYSSDNRNAGSYHPTLSGATAPGAVVHGYAEGGTLLANRPTTLTFGEAGLEMAQITPIGRNGRNVNKIFGNLGGGSGGGAGGNLKLQVVMSEGLIAEIVDTSLRGVQSVFETVKRERR